jgi:DNA-binding transcriptional ArsR family regulator
MLSLSIMRLKRNELIAHPVRLRVLTAMAGRELTVDQLGELLDDVPTPSLYRQAALLIEGGLIEVTRTEGKTRLLRLAENASLLNRAKHAPCEHLLCAANGRLRYRLPGSAGHSGRLEAAGRFGLPQPRGGARTFQTDRHFDRRRTPGARSWSAPTDLALWLAAGP